MVAGVIGKISVPNSQYSFKKVLEQKGFNKKRNLNQDQAKWAGNHNIPKVSEVLSHVKELKLIADFTVTLKQKMTQLDLL